VSTPLAPTATAQDLRAPQIVTDEPDDGRGGVDPCYDEPRRQARSRLRAQADHQRWSHQLDGKRRLLAYLNLASASPYLAHFNFRMLFAVASFTNARGQCRPSLRGLAYRACGPGRKYHDTPGDRAHVHRALAWLVEHGWLKRVEVDGARGYVLCLPPGAAPGYPQGWEWPA